ncbi:MAG: prephenate dehydrogenase/arogenate dehydrogenase family protein, partial [Candidatus Brockarchaeota archaeon]|nr:prephenate dehydrogenase/arogenate dehydrogenase family protein [Candidatus Brockarchaeota archaeon]
MVVKVSIIGGCGAMGKWIVGFLKEIEGIEIIVADPDEIEGAKLVKTMGVRYERENRKASSESDVVIVSVPVENTPEVIAEVAPSMREGSLLVDITSIKTEAISAMLKHSPPGVELVSIHPMFGPRVKDVKGQVVAVIPVRSEKWFNRVKSFLEHKGADIVVTTGADHDRMMSIVQG